MNRAIVDYFRCPEHLVDIQLDGTLSEDLGFFRFGPETICYGKSALGFRSQQVSGPLYDTLADVNVDTTRVRLPLDPDEVIENLRYERYSDKVDRKSARFVEHQYIQEFYHWLRPLLPVHVRKHLQRVRLSDWKSIPFPYWPVDRTVERILDRLLMLSMRAQGNQRFPFVWFWPDGIRGCAIMTHDVEHLAGRKFSSKVMDLDDSASIKSSFGIVPENRYPVPKTLLKEIWDRGFEVSVHDLKHDGRLFSNQTHFLRWAERINAYGKEYGASGFRAGGLYRNQSWYGALDFSYDMSVPSVGHLEPQRGGCCSVTPFFFGHILELPLTMIEDYSLFHIIRDYSINMWKEQLARIVDSHGLASFIVHPDYIIEQRARTVYRELLEHLAQLRDDRKLWIALPGEVDRWWRERSRMKITRDLGTWRIEGAGKERARLAFANVVDNELVFTIEDSNPPARHGGGGLGLE